MSCFAVIVLLLLLSFFNSILIDRTNGVSLLVAPKLQAPVSRILPCTTASGSNLWQTTKIISGLPVILVRGNYVSTDNVKSLESSVCHWSQFWFGYIYVCKCVFVVVVVVSM